MTASRVPTRIAGASFAIDLFLGPATILLALLFSLCIPIRSAYAQLSGGASVDYAYQRSMSRIVAGSGAGLQVSSGSTLNIVSGARTVGSIALNERRIVSAAAMAARAVTLPGLITLGATLLLDYGLQKCADGSWCKKATDAQVPTGQPYPSSGGYYQISVANGSGDNGSGFIRRGSIEELCMAYPAALTSAAVYDHYTDTSCYVRFLSTGAVLPAGFFHIAGPACAPGSTLTNGICYPPGYSPGTQPIPAMPAEVQDAWSRALAANPSAQQQYWSAADQLAKDADWANAGVQPAEVVGTGKVTDVQPAVSTTQDGQTTTKQTTCTYTGASNTDSATMAASPLSVGQVCVTTTTKPDGTQTQETTTTAPRPVGGDNAAPPKIDIDTCGLPGKPMCKIDETGTATEQKPETAAATTQAMDTALGQQRDAITNVLNSQKPDTNWLSWLPQIPRAECAPIEVEALEAHVVSIDWCPSVSFMQILSTAIWAFTCIGFSIAEVRDALNGS